MHTYPVLQFKVRKYMVVMNLTTTLCCSSESLVLTLACWPPPSLQVGQQRGPMNTRVATGNHCVATSQLKSIVHLQRNLFVSHTRYYLIL